METKKIIEINGVKLEVDLTQATVIDNLKVGDKVKVLKKEYSSYSTYAGIIIGFAAFKELPSIEIAYLDVSYSEAKICFTTYNSESKDIEIIKSYDDNWYPFAEHDIIDKMNREILKKQEEIANIKRQIDYFKNNFDRYFKADHDNH